MMTSDFESRILAFEQAWQNGTFPEIARYLPTSQAHGDDQQQLLAELICIDLEYRWRMSAKRNGALHACTLGDYTRKFSALGNLDQLPLELIGEEYRVRQRWGDRPAHAAFLARFEHRQDQIRDFLCRIDLELHAESQSIFPTSRPGPSAVSTPSPSRNFDPRAPLRYGDYLLQRLIGAGRTGKVYRAIQRSLGRPVAVKFLRKSFLRHSDVVERFVNEARTMAQFRHPGLVSVHGLGRTPAGGYFIVLDLIDGPDLARVVNGDSSVPVSDTTRWTRQACDAVEHAHQHGIIHCDLKPGNLLLDRDGSVRVTDFGLARSLEDPATTASAMEGTAPFMAPEQVSAHWGPISTATDVYGLGAALYTLLTRQPPWQGNTPADVLSKIISAASVTRPESHRPGIPANVSNICVRALAKSPRDRFPTARAFADALKECE